jgi:hypothetical protein
MNPIKSISRRDFDDPLEEFRQRLRIERSLFADPSIRSLPVEFAGVYIFPFLKWLAMGDRKGHMYGMWAGRKLGGPVNLPVEFLRRTEREFPELLKPRWQDFERPIPFPS